MPSVQKVIVVGLDGLEPKIVDRLLRAGELPNLASVAAQGGFARLGTTYPPQTPVAWSTFATGTNPGGHGIFDFLRRNPSTYLPDLALATYEQRSAFLPPKAVNRRHGTPLWQILSKAGVASTVLRCPCTFPPDDVRGRMLSGMGVPDLRGGLGTGTFYVSGGGGQAGESEQVVPLGTPDGPEVATVLIGPRNPKTGTDATIPLTLRVDRGAQTVTVISGGEPGALPVRRGEWSDWLRVKFKLGALQSISGLVRFRLARMEPELELYASPINFDPNTPMFPISSPWDYASELARHMGMFYTTGMVEDHAALNNGRIDEEGFLNQCEMVVAERERMMAYELDRSDQGFFFCLYDTSDRLQHMFWRFEEAGHPAIRGCDPTRWKGIIDAHYRRCDAIVGRALEYVDAETLFIVLSDHGFGSFRRGFNTNTWLYHNGLLALKDGFRPGDVADDFFRHVDWQRTKAYAVGLGGIYLNLCGREAEGIVTEDARAGIDRIIVDGLAGLVDPGTGREAIRRVSRRKEMYSGPYADDAPDYLVNFIPGYRASWQTPLGGIPAEQFEDNVKRWSGDHVVDPDLVPGVLFMNRPFRHPGGHLVDMAPTILNALRVEADPVMEGRSLLE